MWKAHRGLPALSSLLFPALSTLPVFLAVSRLHGNLSTTLTQTLSQQPPQSFCNTAVTGCESLLGGLYSGLLGPLLSLSHI